MGWNHHILVCMLGHYFLWHLKIKLEKKAPSITLSQLREIIELVLPLRPKDFDMIIKKVKREMNNNHRSRLSHRKKKLKELTSYN